MDSQVETVPGPQPQRAPAPATGVSDPEHVAGKGQSRATGYNLNICHWNTEGVRTKKLELQTFLKTHSIAVCCIQETHLSPNHRFSVRGFDTFRRDRTWAQRRTSCPGEEHLPSCKNPQIRRWRHRNPRNQWCLKATLCPCTTYIHHHQKRSISTPSSLKRKDGSLWETSTATLPAGDTRILTLKETKRKTGPPPIKWY